MVTLFSTFYSFTPLVSAVHRFSPKKIVLLVSKESLEKEEVKDNISKVKEVFADVSEIQIVSIKCDNIFNIAKATVAELENYENGVIMNFSGGSKFFAFGVCYGCYARSEKVSKMVCTNLDNNKIEDIPKLSLQVSKKQRAVLEQIAKRKSESIYEIAEKMKKSKAIIYQHLKDLRDNGYVTDDFYITDVGRLVLL